MKATIRFFTEDGSRVMRLVDPRERLELLASEQAEKVFRADGTTDGSIKLVTYAPEESIVALPSGMNSPTGLTLADMQRNAMGCVDTPKRRQVYKMREDAQARGEIGGKAVPAAIRCYGHDKRNKPDPELLGNAVDRSMSRVEQWPYASDTNRTVTVTPVGVVGLVEMPPEEVRQLRSLAL